MKKTLIIGGILLIITGLIVIGLFWLALGILAFVLLFVLLTKPAGIDRWWEKHFVITVVATFLATIILAILLRLFVFEVYTIPTGSMEETLIPGDVVWVEKLSYGPALPRSPLEIPWVNAFFLLNKKAIAKSDTFIWDYLRLRGYSGIRHGDVVVFRYPNDPDETYIKRCIALPGDTLVIRDGQVTVNGKLQSLPLHALMEYRVWYNDEKEFQRLTDSLGIGYNELWYRARERIYILNITAIQAKTLARSSVVDSIKLDDNEELGEMAFNTGSVSRQTDSFGQLIIPKAGMHLTPDSSRFSHYGKTFLENEGGGFSPDRSLPVSDSMLIVKGNYYFMMGDNRYRSNDSRVWGLVPEQLIIGKARRILWSGKIKHFKWKRMMKRIR